MTATDELRRLLDERGVEWADMSDFGIIATDWRSDEGAPCMALESGERKLSDVQDGMLSVQANLTPEQAVDATLGRGECKDVTHEERTQAFTCSECGCWVAYDEYWETGIYVQGEGQAVHIHPRFCPNCGRKVIE